MDLSQVSITLAYDRLSAFIARNTDLNPTDIRFILNEYETSKGKDALLALFGYYLYSRTNGHTDKQRMATIIHDLNGRNDEWMEPRTANYLKFAE